MTQEAELAERERLCKQEPLLVLRRPILGKRQPSVGVKSRGLGVRQTPDCFPSNWRKLLNSFVSSSLQDIGHTQILWKDMHFRRRSHRWGLRWERHSSLCIFIRFHFWTMWMRVLVKRVNEKRKRQVMIAYTLQGYTGLMDGNYSHTFALIVINTGMLAGSLVSVFCP